MRRSNQFVLFVAVLGLLALLAAISVPAGKTEAAVTDLTVHLSGANEVPSVDSSGFCFGTFKLNDATGQLDYTLSVQGIAADLVTAAHIHRGAPGVAGPILYTLASGPFTSVSGSVTLTPQDVADFKAGNLYVNVHSTLNPDGFARAQLITPEGQVEATLHETIAAYNAKDVDAFIAHFTDTGLEQAFGAPTREEARADLEQTIGEPPISIQINAIQASNQASASVVLNFVVYLEGHTFSLTESEGAWKISGDQTVQVPVPSAMRAVDLRLAEYSFSYDKTAVADGNFGFRISNAGAQAHEVDLVRLDPGIDLQQVLKMAEAAGPDSAPPEGIEDVAHAGPFDPGEQSTMVLAKPLAPGRYALLCFMPAPDGTPHAFLGMTSEFTVGGGTISPPNTGDAGLLDAPTGAGGFSALLLVAGFLLLGSSAGATLVVRRSR